jgi:hypothetical protein
MKTEMHDQMGWGASRMFHGATVRYEFHVFQLSISGLPLSSSAKTWLSGIPYALYAMSLVASFVIGSKLDKSGKLEESHRSRDDT